MKDATKMKTKEYDYNVYVSEDVLSLCAYEQELSATGQLQTRTDKYKTLKIELTEANHEEIAYLLNTEDWQDDNEWNEYDSWHDLNYLIEGDTPEVIKNWLDKLPEYEQKDNR